MINVAPVQIKERGSGEEEVAFCLRHVPFPIACWVLFLSGTLASFCTFHRQAGFTVYYRCLPVVDRIGENPYFVGKNLYQSVAFIDGPAFVFMYVYIMYCRIIYFQDGCATYMGKAHKNCIIGQKCCLHHITGTAFIIRLTLYVYIVENSETFQKIYSLMLFK